jgi:hypothetical protein
MPAVCRDMYMPSDSQTMTRVVIRRVGDEGFLASNSKRKDIRVRDDGPRERAGVISSKMSIMRYSYVKP